MMNNVDGEFEILGLDIRCNAYLGTVVGLSMINFLVRCWWQGLEMYKQYVW